MVTNPLTAERIAAVWAEAAERYALDPLVKDPRASEALYWQPDDLVHLPPTLAAMEIVREKTPGFFAKHDYAWAFEPTIWRRSLEANYQARAFQHLSMIWRSPHRDPAWPLGDVVLRYAFQTDALVVSPFHLEHAGLHFISIAYAFNDVLLLLFASFLDGLGQVDGNWHMLRTAETPAGYVSPYLKQLLLRMLTSDVFHPSLQGEPPMDVARREIDWFSDAREVSGEAGQLMDHLTMSLIDYALAHELGHRLLDHRGATRLEGDEARIAAEIAADRVGFHLFTKSWGWRDELLEDAPMSELARIMLGPLCFSIFERWYAAALSGLATSCLRARVDPGFDIASLSVRRREAERRTQATFKLVAGHQAEVSEEGASFSARDRRWIERLTQLMVVEIDRILKASSTIPEEDLKLVRSIADPLI